MQKTLHSISWYLTYNNISPQYFTLKKIINTLLVQPLPILPINITCNIYMHKNTHTNRHMHVQAFSLPHSQRTEWHPTDTYTNMQTTHIRTCMLLYTCTHKHTTFSNKRDVAYIQKVLETLHALHWVYLRSDFLK